jgi:hypothetical protein
MTLPAARPQSIAATSPHAYLASGRACCVDVAHSTEDAFAAVQWVDWTTAAPFGFFGGGAPRAAPSGGNLSLAGARSVSEACGTCDSADE